MQMSEILRYAISRKRPTVNTQQEDEDVFYLDTPGKSSSETVMKTAEADRAILQPSLKIPRAVSALQDKVKNTVSV